MHLGATYCISAPRTHLVADTALGYRHAREGGLFESPVKNTGGA